MKIYLINPKFPVTYWGFEYSNDLSGLKYTSPPLGLATLAALTPQDITVEICDENIEAIDFQTDADIIGLTAYLVQGPRAFQIAAEFRKRGKTVVLGGPITSLDPIACQDKVDVVFVGEAEYTWPQFLQAYCKGSYHKEYLQHEHVSMHDSPIPRFDLLKLGKYSNTGIQTTRGCPFNCEFCEIVVLFGRKVRCKAIPQVINEMRDVAKNSIDSIFFTDDNFVGNRKYAKQLLRAIIEFNKTQRTSFQYMAQVSINLANDDELLQLLYEAHFTKVFVGIESPRQDSLKEANKGQNLQSDLIADIKKIHSYNITVAAGMIVGFDHDDTDIFQEHFDFIMQSNVTWAMTGILQAIPSTPLYERMKREHRLDTTTDCNNTALASNIIPKRMTKEQLIAGYTWLMRQLYSHENYAKRVLGALKEYAKHPKVTYYRPTRTQVNIVLRTLRYYLFTFDRKRWKFSLAILKYVFLHKPYTFHAAMVHLVCFKHLHTYVYEQLENAEGKKMGVVEHLEHAVSDKAEALSQQAVAMYTELKARAATVRGQVAVACEELRTYTRAKSQQSVVTYDELQQQAATMIQQEAVAFHTLGKHAAALSHHAVVAYEELGHQATRMSQQVATMNQNIASLYAELGTQAMMVGQQVAFIHQELGDMMSSGSDVEKRASPSSVQNYTDLR